MRDEDKPFVCYQQGWNIKIMPRNAAGWRALGLWMAALLVPILTLVLLGFALDNTPHEMVVLWAVVPLLLIMGTTIIAMIRCMKARSEIIDIDGLVALKRAQERQRKPEGR